ncbi:MULTISPECIES: sporulation inhibitor of replication protein SirA [unclassified Heyndrickxia]|uniref:sporulation inhibitor of replication protein SirA n=1 Tax=unclassified Heyndrickxia TaxID=2837518 RepID=UPI0030FB5E08
MRSYSIYLIKEEFAQYYYGRERMFFNLFHQYAHVSGSLKNVLSRQIHYITKQIPLLPVHHVLQPLFSDTINMTKTGACQLLSKKEEQVLEVTIEERMLRLNVSGSYDTETAVFEILRNFKGNLLAIDYDHKRYGWIKPVKERKFV